MADGLQPAAPETASRPPATITPERSPVSGPAPAVVSATDPDSRIRELEQQLRSKDAEIAKHQTQVNLKDVALKQALQRLQQQEDQAYEQRVEAAQRKQRASLERIQQARTTLSPAEQARLLEEEERERQAELTTLETQSREVLHYNQRVGEVLGELTQMGSGPGDPLFEELKTVWEQTPQLSTEQKYAVSLRLLGEERGRRSTRQLYQHAQSPVSPSPADALREQAHADDNLVPDRLRPTANPSAEQAVSNLSWKQWREQRKQMSRDDLTRLYFLPKQS